MRRAVIALVSLALLIGTAPLAWGTPTFRQAGLRFTATAPLKVKGTDFKGREKIKVLLSLNGTRITREIRATSTGSFTVTFADAQVTDRCSSDVWARASGRRGSMAVAKLPQLQCPPAQRSIP